VVVVGGAAFVVVGLVGAYRYLVNFQDYRGYAPPRDPAFVTQKGSATSFVLASAALGGRRQKVDVYLPAGYAAHPQRRYPVIYLLHGVPGRPGAFLQTVRMGVVEDILVTQHRIQPFILVMPFGSTGTYTDEEWANGVGRNQGWETFVTRDLVHVIDARYRTIPRGAGRVVAGLSEGGYGALNLLVHHPREFRVGESWSGYELADPIRRIFGPGHASMRRNSPMTTVRRVAGTLRGQKSYVWFYSGTRDKLLPQNRAFARELARLGVWHRFRVVGGGHDWSLWRGQAANALLAATRGLEGGSHA
jgi:enterochelin esterase-like enzyme